MVVGIALGLSGTAFAGQQVSGVVDAMREAVYDQLFPFLSFLFMKNDRLMFCCSPLTVTPDIRTTRARTVWWPAFGRR